jgi:Tfp pilus assembly protein PilN
MARVNLIPDQDQESRAIRRRAGRWGAAICCSLPLVAVGFSVKSYQDARAKGAVIETEQLAATIEASRAALAELSVAVGRAKGQRTRALQMQDKRRWSALISEVVGAMPTGVWLTSLSSDPAVPASSRTVAKKSEAKKEEVACEKFDVDAARGLVVKGVCTDPASPLRFVTALKETGLFSSISHDHIRRATGPTGGTFEFEIRCEW